MDLRDFLNRAKVLRSIDRDELVEAGVLSSDDPRGWQEFRDDPIGFLIRASDQQGARLWMLVERRAGR